VSSVLVVLGLPVADHDAGVGQGPKQVDVQVFISEPVAYIGCASA